MAPIDPTINPTQQLSDEANNAVGSFGALQNVINYTNDTLKSFGNSVVNTVSNLEKNGEMSTRSATAFSLLSNAAINAKQAFDNFGKNTMLQTYSQQVSDAAERFSKLGNLTGLKNLASMMGAVIPNEATKTIQTAAKYVKDLASGFFTASDNALKLQNGMIRSAAETGRLGDVIDAAGGDLKNINNILALHTDSIAKSAIATHSSVEAAQEYYINLSKIPGALQATVTSSKNSAQSISMLTAVMQYAAGSGRDSKEIFEDLATAYNKMGMEGAPALLFTARMGEISNKFKIELKDVRESLRTATEDLKNFGSINLSNGQILEGSVRLMNNYVGALKSTGISGATAIGIIGNMRKQILDLDVAQRSFLSSQAGGAGGLKGAFQIEEKIRSGKIDEVMNMVQSTMQKQFGKIVTTKEASENESAASRAILQRQMLQQGPLGAFAKSEQDAARILEAFAARQSGKISEKQLSDTIVENTMDQGLKFQELSATHLGTLVRYAEAQSSIAGVGTLTALQGVMGARTGSAVFDRTKTKEETEREMYLRRGAESAAHISGKRAATLDETYTGKSGGVGPLNNIIGKIALEHISDLKGYVGSLGEAGKSYLNYISRVATDGSVNQKELDKKRAEAQAQVNRARESAARMPEGNAKLGKLVEVESAQAVVNKIDEFKKRINQTTASSRYGAALAPATNQMREDTRALANKRPTTEDTSGSSKQQLQENEGKQVVDVRITGYCIDCGKPMKESNTYTYTPKK